MGMRVSHQLIIPVGLCLTLVINTAQSTARLESWQSYSDMAEQVAICAAFFRLMALQAIVKPRLGKLLKKRQNYA